MEEENNLNEHFGMSNSMTFERLVDLYIEEDPEKDMIIIHIQNCKKLKPTVEDLEAYLEMIRSGDRFCMLTGALNLHSLSQNKIQLKQLSEKIKEYKELIKDILDLIRDSDQNYLRLTLAILIKGLVIDSELEFIELLVKNGIIENYLEALKIHNEDLYLCHTLLGTLSNIARAVPSFQEKLRASNLIDILIKLFNSICREHKPIRPIIYEILATFQAVYQGADEHQESTQKFLPIIAKIFKRIISQESLMEERHCQMISICLEVIDEACQNGKIEEVFSSNIVKDLSKLLYSESLEISQSSMLFHSTDILNFLADFKKEKIQEALQDEGVIQRLYYLVEKFRSIKTNRRICRLLVHLTWKNPTKIEKILDHKPLLHKLMIFITDDDLRTAQLVAFIFANFSRSSNIQHVFYLIRENIFELFYNVLTIHDEDLIRKVIMVSVAIIIADTARELSIEKGTHHPLFDKLNQIGLKKLIFQQILDREGDVKSRESDYYFGIINKYSN